MKEKIWNWCKKHLNSVLAWLVVYFIFLLIWVGAEYTFENGVNMGCVDIIMCGILSAFVSQRM